MGRKNIAEPDRRLFNIAHSNRAETNPGRSGSKGSLSARVSLARGFDAGQDPETQQYDGTDDNPAGGYVQDRCPIN